MISLFWLVEEMLSWFYFIRYLFQKVSATSISGTGHSLRFLSIQVASRVTSAGNDSMLAGRCLGAPLGGGQMSAVRRTVRNPYVEGCGPDCIRCAACGTLRQRLHHRLQRQGTLGVILNTAAAERVLANARDYMCTPDNSIQNPVVALAPSGIPCVVSRMIPFVGQLGVMPTRQIPDTHNARDFGSFLVGAPHEYAVTQEQLADVTDGHMDINRVRGGAALIAPVRVPGGGVCVGDMHAMQGDGEVAGHTVEVARGSTMQVSVLKGVACGGPLILPVYAPALAGPSPERGRKAAGPAGSGRMGRLVGRIRAHLFRGHRPHSQRRHRLCPGPSGSIPRLHRAGSDEPRHHHRQHPDLPRAGGQTA